MKTLAKIAKFLPIFVSQMVTVIRRFSGNKLYDLLPLSLIFETPWNSSPTLQSTLSLLYLGVIATGFAWLIRFRILTVNGLVFQTQVAYLIPVFGVFFGYLLMDEIITWRVIVSLIIILIGIYIVKKNTKI